MQKHADVKHRNIRGRAVKRIGKLIMTPSQWYYRRRVKRKKKSHPRGIVMCDRSHYEQMLAESPNAKIGSRLASNMIYAARYGICEDEHRITEEWKNINNDIRERYRAFLTADEVKYEMNRASACPDYWWYQCEKQ